MPEPDADPSLETEHMTVDPRSYSQLAAEAVREVTFCLCTNEDLSSLSMADVRDSIRTFSATCESWVRSLNVIVPREGAPLPPANRLHVEYQRLLRGVREALKSDLLGAEEQIWKDARQRLLKQPTFAIFRVTRSTVSLQRIESSLDDEPIDEAGRREICGRAAAPLK